MSDLSKLSCSKEEHKAKEKASRAQSKEEAKRKSDRSLFSFMHNDNGNDSEYTAISGGGHYTPSCSVDTSSDTILSTAELATVSCREEPALLGVEESRESFI